MPVKLVTELFVAPTTVVLSSWTVAVSDRRTAGDAITVLKAKASSRNVTRRELENIVGKRIGARAVKDRV